MSAGLLCGLTCVRAGGRVIVASSARREKCGFTILLSDLCLLFESINAASTVLLGSKGLLGALSERQNVKYE